MHYWNRFVPAKSSLWAGRRYSSCCTSRSSFASGLVAGKSGDPPTVLSRTPTTVAPKQQQQQQQQDGNRYRTLSSSSSRRHGRRSSPGAATTRISYMTDAEGDAAYFDRFVERSRVLGFDPDGRTVMFLDDDDEEENAPDTTTNTSMFVYGGDVCDRGGADLYVLRQLLSLQARYGSDRVHFILGNRDVNKMRLTQELGLRGGDDDVLPAHDGCWWLRGTGSTGDPESRDGRHRVPTNAPDRLRWILRHTMGSPDAFELRRAELQRDRRINDSQQDVTRVTDDDVVRSYVDTCRPDGHMGRYLRQAHLALQLGNVLFLHGGLPLTPQIVAQQQQHRRKEHVSSHPTPPTTTASVQPTNFWHSFDFAMPWKINTSECNGDRPTADNIDSDRLSPFERWMNALHEFKEIEMKAWVNYVTAEVKLISDGDTTSASSTNAQISNTAHSKIWSTKGGYPTIKNDTNIPNDNTFRQKGEALMQYGMGWTPDRLKNNTVVYASWLDDGMPKHAADDRDYANTFLELVRDFFAVADVELIVTGHQPHGDMPLPLRIDYDDDTRKRTGWILACDTSYSGDTQWLSSTRKSRGREGSITGRGNVAVSEVLIDVNLDSGDVVDAHYHGILGDGSSYQSTSLMDDKKKTCSSTNCHHIGTVLDQASITILEKDSLDEYQESTAQSLPLPHQKWCVKCKLPGDRYIVSAAKGYDVWNAIATIP